MAAEQDLKLDDGSAAAPAAGGGKKKMLFILIGAAVVLVAAAVGVTFWLVKGDEPAEGDAEVVAEEAPPPLLPVQYVIMKPEFVVSFQTGTRQRFLQVSIEIMTRNPVVIEALKLHDPLLRNEIIRIISEQNFDHLRTAEGRVELQQKLLEHVAMLVKRESAAEGVEAVLFTNYVMQ